MASLHRFYILRVPSENEVLLDKTQSHHLVKVLRFKKGDTLELFDKEGNSYNAEIISLGESVRLKILSQIHNSQSAISNSIALATAIPKGARMDWLVEKCAELGLTKLIPIETKYSVVKDCGLSKISRWKKIAIEAVKQSHQPHLMEIEEILSFDRLLDSINQYDVKLLATLEGEPLSNIELTGEKGIIYLIGPEGGFSPDEISRANEAGFKAVRLPVDGILRIETAALTMLAILKYGDN